MSKKKGRDLVELPESAYAVLDRLDERMMEMELAGTAARELVYSFRIEGREITGLSWAGAKALARWMATKGHPLDAVEKDITDDEEAWYADVRAVDRETGLGLWGSSRQPKMKKLRSGEERPDRFARTIALNKAQRNAIRAHVPDKMIAQFIKKSIDEGRMRKVTPEEVKPSAPPRRRVPARQAPPPRQPPAEPPEAPGFRPGKISLNVIEYNLRAAGVDVDTTVDIVESAAGFSIEPKRDLGDGEWYKIDEMLKTMGARWEQRGLVSRWVIKKESWG